jgi:CO/xanthine dehydrogenase FAD-binding subunit
VLTSQGGERVVPLTEFFTGPGTTVIQPGEMMTEIRIRPTGQREGSSYMKVGRRQAMTLAVFNATSRVKLDASGNCEEVSIGLGACAPTPMRASNAEAVLRGQPFTEEAVAEAAEAAAQEIRPIDDVHGTAWYRRKLARVLVARTLREAGGLNGGAS